MITLNNRVEHVLKDELKSNHILDDLVPSDQEKVDANHDDDGDSVDAFLRKDPEEVFTETMPQMEVKHVTNEVDVGSDKEKR